jgi:transcription initiation factor TFIIIB Brf1 subunit/transcription initiation factor TFIIB
MGNNTIVCPKCGATNWENATECEDCGMVFLAAIIPPITKEELQAAHVIKPFTGILPHKLNK